MRGLYGYRRRRFAARSGAMEAGDEENYEDRSTAFQRFQYEILAAQRAELLQLRNEGLISDEVMRRVERPRSRGGAAGGVRASFRDKFVYLTGREGTAWWRP